MKLQSSMLRLEAAPAFLSDLVDTLTERGRSLLFGRGDRPDADGKRDLVSLAEALLSRRGEASGVVLAQALLARFKEADTDTRCRFLLALADRLGPDPAAVEAAIDAYRTAPGSDTLSRLHTVAEPRRQELFRRLNLAPRGTAALVAMREALLEELDTHPELATVDADFVHLFSSWFNRGFLVLRKIDWTTPANILEKIIRYEAVHAIEDWNDLRSRLEPADRHCYGFFHPQLVDEPLIFVEIALTREPPDAIGPLLDLTRQPIDPTEATTAVFYSISNTQKGLAGVSFGHFLIKQVVEELKREVPSLKTFVTLSPVPGFARWLEKAKDEPDYGLDAETRAALARLPAAGEPVAPELREALRPALSAAAAHYFLKAKGRNGRALDPVARFHLGNGARLERLNLWGDGSQKGLKQSHGLMVNYLYDLDRIEANHEAYAERGEIAAASAIRKLIRTETTKPKPQDTATLPAPARVAD
ncbi:malonyl-CoA decarboxylase [Methyloraptor flagellatus]|uniref:Malonyl-CoA decarboxylase n=1 Tax=Methyloraptor flagellatus TaxID=3162530 RepID=A0AAU7XAT0_9HYPH